MSGEYERILPNGASNDPEAIQVVGGEEVETPHASSKGLKNAFHHLRPSEMPHKWKRILYGLFGILIALGIAVGIVIGLYYGFVAANDFSRFPGSIDVANMMTHLQAFQDIASNYSNSRSPFYGYNASVQYVVDTLLKNTDLKVTILPFSFPYNIEPVPPTFSINTNKGSSELPYGTEWMSARNQGSGTVTAKLSFVPNLGCNASDWANFTAKSIAVVNRGVCLFTDKALLAQANNASGLLVVNYQGEALPAGVSMATQINFPVFIVTYDLGLSLQMTSEADPSFNVTMFSSAETITVYTSNIIADTPTGNPNKTIVVGSHLDSVTAGPGINDNGSGSAANLEMALNIYRVTLANRVRFAWWGAEELGLLGSTAYVASLTPEELAEIAVNLNFDMLGSPNYFRGVYDGRSADPAYPLLLNGSSVIQQLFEEYFSDKNEVCDSTNFDGRSDYGPFLEKNIPCGGLFTGAEVIKSETMVERYGGIANAPYDPCYHQYCDTVLNINQDVYNDMGKAAATVLETLATQPDLDAYFAENAIPDDDHVPCASVSSVTARPLRANIDVLLK